MPAKRQVWPRRARRTVQTLTFLLFLAFIVAMPRLAVSGARGDWLMRLSPFSALAASVSSRQLLLAFWPALAVLVATVLLGRFFCGWVCPLGTTLDIGDKVIRFFRGRTSRTDRRQDEAQEDRPDFEHIRARRFKHYLLAACLVGAALSVSFFGLFDPLSIVVRSYVLVVHGYVSQALTVLLGALGADGAVSSVRSALVVWAEPLFELHTFTFLVLLALLALGFVRRRLWCRYLCPLGSLYALAARPALTKRSATEACIECGRCAEACPTSCISPDGRRTLNDECILCLDCQAVCPTGAVRFLAATPAGQKTAVDLTRRGVLAGVAAGVVAYPVFRLGAARTSAKGPPMIRPPLAGRDLEAFLSKCLRCGQCMGACPTNVIHPAGLETGLEGLWTPKLVPRPGHCAYDCNSCGQACPSGAIPPFTLEEKHATAMGLAYLDRSRCIPWRTGRSAGEEDACGLCAQACPVPDKAIHYLPVYGAGGGAGGAEGGQPVYLPHVLEGACVGCGACEAICPVVGPTAIRVTGGFRELPALEFQSDVEYTF